MAQIEQPTIDMQKLLSDLMEQKPEKVTFCGKTYKIGWLHNGTSRKFTKVMLNEENALKKTTKACACVLLNKKSGLLTWFLLWSWYWIYWRWLYYIVDMDQVEIAKVLDCAKKKIQSTPLLLSTILATAMVDTMMTMARHELGRAGLGGVQPTP